MLLNMSIETLKIPEINTSVEYESNDDSNLVLIGSISASVIAAAGWICGI